MARKGYDMPGEIDGIAAEIERIRAEYGRREREISSDRYVPSQPASLFSCRVRQKMAAPGAAASPRRAKSGSGPSGPSGAAAAVRRHGDLRRASGPRLQTAEQRIAVPDASGRDGKVQ